MFTFRLTCGHTARSSFQKHHYLYCLRCEKERPIIGEWKVKCRDCKYARLFGAARINAELAIDNHYIKTNHRMYLLYDGRVILRILPIPESGTLDLWGDTTEPPF